MERLDIALSARQDAIEAQADRQERQQILNTIARIFNEAHNAEWELIANMGEGMNSMGTLAPTTPDAKWAPNAYWEEFRKASRFYGELKEHARTAGLKVHDPQPGQSVEVEEAAA